MSNPKLPLCARCGKSVADKPQWICDCPADARTEAIRDLRRKLADVHRDTDRSGGYYEYCDALGYAIERLEKGDDIEEVLSNV